MKNKAGKIIGFLIGFAGFLLFFKLVFLDRLTPEDELAPGVVMIAAAVSGVVLGYLGGLVQQNFIRHTEI
ncbi:hypothetical protein [Daejeonella lutea]|nr:hypothetical protein [Daejeonella lutea]